MRTADLERDDSLLPFAFFLSFLLHIFLVALASLPEKTAAPVVEHITSTVISYRNFPEKPQFLAFSSKERIFSSSPEGIPVATSGDMKTEPDKLAPRPVDLKVKGQPIEEPLPAIETRKVYGAPTSATEPREAPPAPAEEPRRRLPPRPSLPEGPEGFASDFDPSERKLPTPIETVNPTPRKREEIRESRETPAKKPDRKKPDEPLTVGALEVLDKSHLDVTAPQTPTTQDHRFYTDALSTGENVTESLPQPPKPQGGTSSTDPSRYGRRRLLLSPKPEYPDWAAKSNVQTSVTFHITITPDGRVNRELLAISSGYPDLDRLAAQAVRMWLYEPLPGQTEERKAVVNFVLKEKPRNL